MSDDRTKSGRHIIFDSSDDEPAALPDGDTGLEGLEEEQVDSCWNI